VKPLRLLSVFLPGAVASTHVPVEGELLLDCRALLANCGFQELLVFLDAVTFPLAAAFRFFLFFSFVFKSVMFFACSACCIAAKKSSTSASFSNDKLSFELGSVSLRSAADALEFNAFPPWCVIQATQASNASARRT
jgi:hypothetical protein